MSSQVVEELVMELKLELAKFRSQTQEAERLNASLKNSVESVESATGKASEATDGLADSTEKAGKQTEATSSALAGATTKLARFFTTITSAVALERLASSVAKVNDQLNFMQQRLDLSARSIMGISNAAAALGGDAGAMQETMRGLNQQIQQLVIMGDASVLPFFNALGVGVVDAQGKVRDMDQIILDMADSLSSLDPRQAYAIASAMGLDDATTNALVQGRDALQEMLSMQDAMYVSTQAELDASRELNKQQSILGAQYAGLKIMLGNALIPLLTKLTTGAQNFTEFLLRNERSVKNVFEGLSYVVGVLLVGATYKALAAMTALLIPIGAALAPVLALGAAFIALYDDYKVWSEGGKSLFDWTKFDNYIKSASFSVENLKEALVRLLTGYNSWDEAVKGLTEWLQLKGFLDETGVSVDSLAKGFKNLIGDMLESMPVLQKIISAFSKIASGDFTGALKDIAGIPAEAAKGAARILTGTAEHVAGAIDTAFGVDPEGDGSISGFVRGVRGAALGRLEGDSAEQDIDEDRFKALLIEEDRRQNYPLGTMYALWLQETGGSMDYVKDPEKYHYEKNAEGKRIAGHTGKISTATGPFGILRSTGRDPGYGVAPMRDWSDIREHIRFAGDYSKARGFAAYGEGGGYAKQVVSKVDPVAAMPKSYREPAAAPADEAPAIEAPGIDVSAPDVEMPDITAPVNVTVLPPDTLAPSSSDVVGGDNYVTTTNNNTENNYITREKPAPVAALINWFNSLPLIGKDSGSNEHAARAESINQGTEFARTQNYTSEQVTNNQSVKNEYNINMGGISVQTSASNMQNVTQEAVMAGAEKASTSLDQIAGGL